MNTLVLMWPSRLLLLYLYFSVAQFRDLQRRHRGLNMEKSLVILAIFKPFSLFYCESPTLLSEVRFRNNWVILPKNLLAKVRASQNDDAFLSLLFSNQLGSGPNHCHHCVSCLSPKTKNETKPMQLKKYTFHQTFAD